MKRINKCCLLFSISVLLSVTGRSQYFHIPDPGLADALYHYFINCSSPYGYLDTTCAQVINTTELTITDPYNIVNLDGIQYFRNLITLTIGNVSSLNNITNIPEFPGKIKYLTCIATKVTAFPTLPDSLITFDCRSSSNLTTLPLLPSSIKYIDCSQSYQCVGLPSLPDSLEFLKTVGTSIGIFPILPNKLRYLDCSQSGATGFSQSILPDSLRKLDATNTGVTGALPQFNQALSYFGVGNGNNYITSITMPVSPASLDTLIVVSLTPFYLPALPSSLKVLNASPISNANIPPLPPSLKFLNIGGNLISSLPALPSSLTYLNCYSLPNLFCLPRLPQSLTRLDVTANIGCLPNIVPGLSVYQYFNMPVSLPICSVINNVHHCVSFPVISGHIFYDNNSNGIKDANENYRANVQVQLSNGITAFTNSNGYYELSADIGNITLSVNAPQYYNVVPSSVNYNFSSYDTVVNQLIALQPTTSVDSLSINLTAVNTPRPGFGFYYNISYENVGTTTLNPNIVLNYDNNLLTYNSSSNAAVINNGTSLSLGETNFTPGQHNSFTASFTVKPSTPVNAVIGANAAISANSAIATDSTHSIVISSLDPNNKEATTQLTLQDVADGKYIDYLIRFQNTGNVSAINVVVTDTLSSLLKNNSLQMVTTSHPCVITQDGNKLAFEFLNIMLPSKNVDEPGSHGFIRFRVMPQPGAAVNTLIPNHVNIYFDYNAGVLTNTANTLIQPNPIPLNLLTFKAFLNNSNNVLLSWTTANEINTRSFEIEQSTDANSFFKIGSVNANGSGDNSYNFRTILMADLVYYRLKMIDIDGRYTYSFIIPVKRTRQPEKIAVLNNPVQQTLSIVVNDISLVNSNATIINEQGQLVQSFVLVDGLQNIDISKLAAGIYYLKAIGITEKIIISR